MFHVYSWVPSVEQGTSECAIVLQDLLSTPTGTNRSISWTIDKRSDGTVALWCSDKSIADKMKCLLDGMVIMIGLLSPDPGVNESGRHAVRQLQRLIFHNLNHIKPPLVNEPYVEGGTVIGLTT